MSEVLRPGTKRGKGRRQARPADHSKNSSKFQQGYGSPLFQPIVQTGGREYDGFFNYSPGRAGTQARGIDRSDNDWPPSRAVRPRQPGPESLPPPLPAG